MYPELFYPSKLMYSIYTGREVQCNATNIYTQSILSAWYQSLVFSILEVFHYLRPCRHRGDRSRLHRGQHPWFTTDHIDHAAFVALTSSCISRFEVSTCLRRELTVLRPEHLVVATVCLASVLKFLTALQQCVQVGMCRRWDDDNGIDHCSPQQQAARTAAP
jgi:hypothetical protein